MCRSHPSAGLTPPPQPAPPPACLALPQVLYEDVVEIDELVSLPIGPDPNPRNGAHAAAEPRLPGDYRTGPTGEEVVVRRPPDLAAARAALQRAFDAGTRSVAVLLKHAAVFPDHELAVGALCREIGFAQVSLSHQVMPMVKMVPRGYTVRSRRRRRPATQTAPRGAAAAGQRLPEC